MRRGQRHLHEPVEVGCRQLAAVLLATAAENSERLSHADDADALHDFRVSVRRLVSFLQAYRPHLRHKGYGKLRQQFVQLIRATNAGRDTEVHTLWLKAQLGNSRVPKLQREGLKVVLAAVSTDTKEVQVAPRRKVAKRFDKARQQLDHRLTRPLESVRVNEAGEVMTFGVATGGILAARAEVLRARLGRVSSMEQLKRAHRARLAAKRLRYVLDPVRNLVPGGRETVSRLKQLQDVLGDLRDLQTLETTMESIVRDAMGDWSQAVVEAAFHDVDPIALSKSSSEEAHARAVVAAVQRLRSEQRRLFTLFTKKWLDGHADAFFARLNRISDFLNPARGPDPAAPMQPPVETVVEPVGEEPTSAAEEPTGADLAVEDPPAEESTVEESAAAESTSPAEEAKTGAPRPIQNVNWVYGRQNDPPARSPGIRARRPFPENAD